MGVMKVTQRVWGWKASQAGKWGSEVQEECVSDRGNSRDKEKPSSHREPKKYQEPSTAGGREQEGGEEGGGLQLRLERQAEFEGPCKP